MSDTTEHWLNVFAESIRDWLVANGVDWDRTICWPELRVEDDHFEVEMFYLNGAGQHELMRGGGSGGILTHLARFEHRVKIDPGLLAAYQYSRPGALKARELEQVERFLRNNCPSLIRIEPGRRLVWLTRDRYDADQSAAVYEALGRNLPGFQHTLVCGVDAVMQADPVDGV